MSVSHPCVFKLKGMETGLVEMKNDPYRLDPQGAHIRIPLPPHRMPNPVRVIREDRIAILY